MVATSRTSTLPLISEVLTTYAFRCRSFATINDNVSLTPHPAGRLAYGIGTFGFLMMGISRTLNDKLSQTEDVSCLRDESPSVNTIVRPGSSVGRALNSR